MRKVNYRKRAGVSTAVAVTIIVVAASLAGATLMLNGDLLASKDVQISVRIVNNTTPSKTKTPPITNKNDSLRDEPDQHPPVDVDDGKNQLSNFTLTVVAPEGSGSNTPGTGNHAYIQGTIVQAEATPDPNWVFSHWLLDGSKEYSNPVTIVMNITHYLKPVFTAILYNLTIGVDGSGSTTPASGTHTYINGTRLFLNATASKGWKFNFWTLDDKPYADNPMSLIMTRDYELSATFTPIVLPSFPP
ncbi:hypothetical protein A3K78_03210 [Candidatus Bathyarchaeota archaeon RBG_13_52_12]|nr:MAG: hypothetical protein A3K78_03210 [Candidatus Bathyarchaeota archaeon RBG_13_52_12]